MLLRGRTKRCKSKKAEKQTEDMKKMWLKKEKYDKTE